MKTFELVFKETLYHTYRFEANSLGEIEDLINTKQLDLTQGGKNYIDNVATYFELDEIIEVKS